MNCIYKGYDLLRSGGNLLTYLKLLNTCGAASARARFSILDNTGYVIFQKNIENNFASFQECLNNKTIKTTQSKGLLQPRAVPL